MNIQKRNWYLGVGALSLGIILVYFRTLSYEFLRWDDNVNITANPFMLNGQWIEFWKDFYYGLYIPVAYSVWNILFAIGDADPAVFHGFNILLHILNTVLVVVLLQRWLKAYKVEAQWPAFLGAALFAFHPVNVETVAWVSGGRDLLAASFALAALLSGPVLGFAFFTVGILSKPSVVALPLIFYILYKGRYRARFAALWCLPVGLLAYVTSREQGVAISSSHNLFEKLWIAFDSLGFYITKLVFPFPLAGDYGRTPTLVVYEQWLYAAIFIVTALCIFWLHHRKHLSALPFVFWVVALLPVSGLVAFAFQEYSSVADRYNYFPSAFLSLAVALAAVKIKNVRLAQGAGFALILVLAAVSFMRTPVWTRNLTFYSDMLEKNPKSFSALMGLGAIATDENRDQQALEYYLRAHELRRGAMDALDAIIMSYTRLDRYREALSLEKTVLIPGLERYFSTYFRTVSNIFTSFATAHYNLGNYEISAEYFCMSIKLNPYLATYQNNFQIARTKIKTIKPEWECPEQVEYQAWRNRVEGLLARAPSSSY